MAQRKALLQDLIARYGSRAGMRLCPDSGSLQGVFVRCPKWVAKRGPGRERLIENQARN